MTNLWQEEAFYIADVENNRLEGLKQLIIDQPSISPESLIKNLPSPLLFITKDVIFEIFKFCLVFLYFLGLSLFLTGQGICLDSSQRQCAAVSINLLKKWFIKGVFAKNKRGYRLTAKNKLFWSLLILLPSVASIKRKLLKTTHVKDYIVHITFRKLKHSTRIVKK